MAALGYVIAAAEDAATANTTVAYWNGRTLTEDATQVSLDEAETFVDGELPEVELMSQLGNLQVAFADKYLQLKRVSISVSLV